MDSPTEEHLVRLALGDVEGIESMHFDLGRRTVSVAHEGTPDRICAALAPLCLGVEVDSTAVPAEPPLAEFNDRQVLIAVLAINATMFVAVLVAGLWAQSSALVADSVDFLVDASVYTIALAAAGGAIAAQRRSAVVSGWLQLSLAGLVLLEVVRRSIAGSEPQSTIMVVAGGTALLAKVAAVLLLAAHRDSGLHMRASWIFTVNDTVSNLGVIAAGVLVAVTGSQWPDLAVGVAIAVLVGAGALRILWISRRSAFH